MDKTIFVIPQRAYGKASKVITMRIEKQLLAELDAAAEASGRSRNEIISAALEFSLHHLVLSEFPATPSEAENSLHIEIKTDDDAD